MTDFFCPGCGSKNLVGMPEPHRFACMGCRHIYDIKDVILCAARHAGLPTLFVLHTPRGRVTVRLTGETVEGKGGGDNVQ